MTDSPDIRELAGYVDGTPERFVPELMARTEIEAEHRARYRWAMALAKGRRVLDSGCGTGYGTRLMIDAGAAAVAAIDISEAAVRAAGTVAPEASFFVGDVRALPFGEASFDLVVAFELLEHVLPQEQVVDEFRRVLAPGGVVAISSPNRVVTVPGNPHHLHELVPDEFERLLRDRFSNVELYRQRNWVASALLDKDAAESTESRLPLAVWKTAGLCSGAELYMVALASEAPLPSLEGVAYLAPTDQLRGWVERVASLEDELAERDAELSKRLEEVAERDAELSKRLEEVAERDAELDRKLAARDAELAARDAEVMRLVAMQAQVEHYVGQLQSTLSWRVTKPLRVARGLLPGRTRASAAAVPDIGNDTSETRNATSEAGREVSRCAAVLYVSAAPDVSARYRCDHQAEQLLLLGGTVTIARHGEYDLVDALDRHELVVLHRVPWGDDVAALLEHARQTDKQVLFDTDDLLFDPRALADIAVLEELPDEEARLYVEGVHRLRRTLEECSGATVSTEPLAQRVRELGVPASVTPNVATAAMVEAAEEALRRRANGATRIVVGYMSGTKTHRKDFEVAARGVVDALRDRRRTELRIVGPLGIDVPLDSLEGRVTRFPLQSWSHLADYQASIDINLAPLESDNAFTACKSSIKWLEAALVARPTIASPRPDFERVIRTGENGFLAESPEEWLHAVATLVDDTPLRHRLGERARTDALSAHTTKARAPSYVRTLRELAPRPDPPLVINWILYSPIQHNSGGYRNIFRIANALGESGHRQRMVVKRVDHLAGLDRSEVANFVDSAFGIPPNAEVLVGHEDIPEADVSLATYWPTAYTVVGHQLSRFKGYFVQDFEPEFYEESDPAYREAERTYLLPLRHICLGAHLGQRLRDFSEIPSLVVDFALDPHFEMTKRPEERGDVPRVLFFARPTFRRRGYDIGVQALAEVKRCHPDCEVVFFGSPTDELGEVPFPFRNLGVIDVGAVARAMNEAHILLTFSLTNISNVPFEGMACGCAVVELDTPNVSTMTRPGENCLLAPLNPRSLADGVSRLIEHPELRIRLGVQGAADMAGRNWQRTATMFDEALRELCFLPRLQQAGSLASRA